MERIKLLGGKQNFTGESLLKDMQSVSFERKYLNQGFDEYLSDELYEKIKNGEEIEESDITNSHIEYRSMLFTPFTKGTPDYEEWENILDEHPEYPTMYSTDHEEYFTEIERLGTLEDFFNEFVSDVDFVKKIEELRCGEN